MKIAVVYNLVEKPTGDIPLPDNWDIVIKRFANSFVNYDSGCSHDLYICSSGGPLSDSSKEIFRNINYKKSITYTGGGWDIGAYQFCAKQLENYDFVICLNSQAYIAYADWLESFKNAFKRHGVGIYGASSSFEVAPHIRTSCIAFSPRLINNYPLKVCCRYDACVFEHSPKNFSLWALKQGLPVMVVMRSGIYSLLESRRKPNIFRHGSQEELLINDRHTAIYNEATSIERELLEKLANGETKKEFHYLNPIRHFVARHAGLEKYQNYIVKLKVKFFQVFKL